MVIPAVEVGFSVIYVTSCSNIYTQFCTCRCAGRFSKDGELFLGNAGTAMRPLTAAVAAAGRGTYVLDGVPRMRERPIQDLVTGLNQLGVKAECTLGTGCPPVTVRRPPLPLASGFHQVQQEGVSREVCGLGLGFRVSCPSSARAANAKFPLPCWGFPTHLCRVLAVNTTLFKTSRRRDGWPEKLQAAATVLRVELHASAPDCCLPPAAPSSLTVPPALTVLPGGGARFARGRGGDERGSVFAVPDSAADGGAPCAGGHPHHHHGHPREHAVRGDDHQADAALRRDGAPRRGLLLLPHPEPADLQGECARLLVRRT